MCSMAEDVVALFQFALCFEPCIFKNIGKNTYSGIDDVKIKAKFSIKGSSVLGG